MLKLIDKPPNSENEVFQATIELMNEFDGFLLIGIKNNKLYPIQYHISKEEIVYACEYVKSKIFVEGGID